MGLYVLASLLTGGAGCIPRVRQCSPTVLAATVWREEQETGQTDALLPQSMWNSLVSQSSRLNSLQCYPNSRQCSLALIPKFLFQVFSCSFGEISIFLRFFSDFSPKWQDKTWNGNPGFKAAKSPLDISPIKHLLVQWVEIKLTCSKVVEKKVMALSSTGNNTGSDPPAEICHMCCETIVEATEDTESQEALFCEDTC